MTFNEDWSVSEIIHVIEERLGYQEKARDLIIQIKSVDNAEIIYMSEDGELYSSDEGYLGQAEKVKGVNTITSSHLKNNRQKIISKSKENPTVNEIHGGNTGAFERRQLNFSGFDGIQATVILPYISNLSTGEQPWVYFGFDAPNVIGVEGGYSYQTGSKTWIPYIRNQNGFQYKSEDAQKKKDGESVHIKFYVKKELDGKIYAYLLVNYSNILVSEVSFNSLSSLAVKRVTSIAKNNFDGANINGKSQNQKWENLIVSKHDSDYYYPWSDYAEYKYWDGSKWYGTIDCLPSYIKRNLGYVSIYK